MMEGWKEYILEDLGFVGRGKSRHRPRNEPFLYGDKYPFVQTADVKSSNNRISTYTQMYSEKGLKQSKLWPVNTLCITIAANIADAAILDIEACFPDSIIGFIPDSKKSDVQFVKYLFDLLQVSIKQISQGAAQDNLSLEKLRSIKFLVPPLPTQNKIASILSAYDDLIENNLQRIKLLEEMAQQTYTEWFVRMKFPGHESVERDDETELPEGWERKIASKLFNIKIGKTPPRGETHWFNTSKSLKWISIRDMRNSNLFIFNTNETIDEKAISKFNFNVAKKDTVILSFKLTVGLISIVTENMVTNEAIAHFNTTKNSPLSKEYTYLYLKSFNYDTMGSTSSIGTAINSKIVKRIPILVPDVKTLLNFNTIIEPVFKSIKNLQTQNQLLKEARDILLPRLMTGMIEV